MLTQSRTPFDFKSLHHFHAQLESHFALNLNMPFNNPSMLALGTSLRVVLIFIVVLLFSRVSLNHQGDLTWKLSSIYPALHFWQYNHCTAGYAVMIWTSLEQTQSLFSWTLYFRLQSCLITNNCLECGVREWDCNWKEGSKTQYHGRKSTTKKGTRCLAWNKVPKVAGLENPFEHETHNYCRCDKSNCQDPWCFISTYHASMRRQEIHPEDCGVRDCMECDSGEILLGGLPFSSEIKKTISHLW